MFWSIYITADIHELHATCLHCKSYNSFLIWDIFVHNYWIIDYGYYLDVHHIGMCSVNINYLGVFCVATVLNACWSNHSVFSIYQLVSYVSPSLAFTMFDINTVNRIIIFTTVIVLLWIDIIRFCISKVRGLNINLISMEYLNLFISDRLWLRTWRSALNHPPNSYSFHVDLSQAYDSIIHQAQDDLHQRESSQSPTKPVIKSPLAPSPSQSTFTPSSPRQTSSISEKKEDVISESIPSYSSKCKCSIFYHTIYLM